MELQKFLSLALYGVSSFAITVVNKIVLTSYGFPSYAFLAVCQMLFIIILLSLLHCLGRVKLTSLSRKTFLQIMPLPLLYVMNAFFGLGGTKELSLPMFVVLRRFAILFTLILESYLLKQRSSLQVKFAVFIMIFGAVIAAWYDMGFDSKSYLLIFFNNIATATNNVLTKVKLVNKDIDKQSLVFYNCIFGVIPLLCWTVHQNEMADVVAFSNWTNYSFVLAFLTSCSSAYILLISAAWCIEANSPLTTTIVGVLKNSIVTYIGMFIGGDYIFNWPNFVGVTVSLLGAIVYTTAEMKPRPAVEEKKPAVVSTT